ncbi:MAG TPA: glutamine amidotransferase [Spirochaetota bacterium]|nr:glutamine amidotransferase [Spirochaetota bacterium]HPH01934.1 glutamine amidotransferase [Spirochaetota bacterium]HPN82610.1 glutamine amidotransferase [Spirochaetota bacterium]
MMDCCLRVGHLYPDHMNLYGDRGNVMAFVYRAGLRGIRVSVEPLQPGDRIEPGRYDFFFFGGGQDAEQERIYEDFLSVKGGQLARELDSGAACLAVCGGYQLLGKSYEAFGGKIIPGLGWFDVRTEAGKTRAIGNILIESDINGNRVELAGFENHGGMTFLGPGVSPLGRVLVGSGNNGQDGSEGALVQAVVGTYLHGPVLPKNPVLADWLVARSLEHRYPGRVLEDVESRFEDAAFSEARRITLEGRGVQREQFGR